ncbi:MAG: hypothetical protein AAGK02_07105 [Pseudomonadota bacterium]
MFNAGQTINAFQTGQDRSRERKLDNAFAAAGGALSAGDYGKASTTLLRAGELPTGLQVMEMGQNQQAGQREQQAEQLKAVRGVLGKLQSIQDPMQRGQALQSIAPQLGPELSQGLLKGLQKTGGLYDDADFQEDLLGVDAQLAQLGVGPEVAEPYTLAPGARRFEGNQMVAENPKELTPDLPNGMMMGPNGPEWVPGYLEGQKDLKAAGRSTTTINNNLPANKGETAFAQQAGKQGAEGMADIMDRGDKANRQLSNLSTMETLLDQVDYTGFGAESRLAIQKAGRLFGVELGDVAASEAAKRLTSEMGLALKENLPGPMSDADRQFLLSIPPGIGNTPEGNEALLYIMRKRSQFDFDMQQSMLRANPQSLEEMRAWENEFRRTYPPLFSDQDRMDLMQALGAG